MLSEILKKNRNFCLQKAIEKLIFKFIFNVPKSALFALTKKNKKNLSVSFLPGQKLSWF